MNKKICISAATAILIFISTLAFAQPGGTGGGQGQGGNPPGGGGSVPIDGGAISLVLGVAAYGYKKFKEEKNV